MRLYEIEKKARGLGMRDTWKYSKKHLIRNIQRKEGYAECFSTPVVETCGQLVCCWREDCLR